jgi:hypothetical protein
MPESMLIAGKAVVSAPVIIFCAITAGPAFYHGGKWVLDKAVATGKSALMQGMQAQAGQHPIQHYLTRSVMETTTGALTRVVGRTWAASVVRPFV